MHLVHPVPQISARGIRGVTMLEVLIAIVILAIGLLGVASLQAKMQAAEFEAYQRSQAVVLLEDMVDRINANRKNAANYVTGSYVGTGGTLNCAAPATMAAKDLCAWDSAIKGAAEVSGGSNLGAMADGRGCITMPVSTMPREMVVAIVWQGVTPTLAPASTTCGTGLYGDERTRRALIARVKIGCLQNDPTTGLCVTP